MDCLAISYGTMHGANKGAHVKLRREIAIAASENLRHEHIFGVLVSHGSSTVPSTLWEINALGGSIHGAAGVPLQELQQAIPCGIGKINVRHRHSPCDHSQHSGVLSSVILKSRAALLLPQFGR